MTATDTLLEAPGDVAVRLNGAQFRQGRNLLVVWRVTTSCNLDCGFCGYRRSAGGLRVRSTQEDVEGFAETLANYRRETGSDVRVSWLGGEPFMWRPIHDVSATMHRCGVSLSATTNGSALGSERVARTLDRYFDEIIVSLDGRGLVHDESRGRAGLYDRVLRSVAQVTRTAAGGAPRVGVNLLLTADSVRQLDDLCRELGSVGVAFLTFNPLIVSDLDPMASRKLGAESLALLEDFRSRRDTVAADTGVMLSGSDAYMNRVRTYVAGRSVQVHDCSPGRWRLFVDEFGFIRPCTFVGGPIGVPVADITSVQDLQSLPRTFAAGIQRSRPTACGDCMDTFVFGKFATT